MNVILVFCTFPSLEQARQIGTSLVDSQHAACVNLIPAIESIYRWQGTVETSQEVLAIFKTTSKNYPNFEKKLRELHPYKVPEIIALEPTQTSELYAKWVQDSTCSMQE